VSSFILAILTGSASGILAGLLPGIGSTITVAIFFPLLLYFDPTFLIIAFACHYSMSQYIGSVPAITLGIPGETTSLPAVTEGIVLRRENKYNQAIAFTAIGSLVGSVLCLLFVYLTMDYIYDLAVIYKTSVQSVLLLLVVLLLIFVGGNSWFVNILMILGGVFLAAIGSHEGPTYTFLTFDNADLMMGLPLFPVLIALFVIPSIYQSLVSYKQSSVHIPKFTPRLRYFIDFFKYSASSLRGTIFGFIGGFCPGLTNIFSTQISYFLEKIISKKDSLRSLISAETANNAGSISALLPLIVLGLPISSSEALILALLELKSFELSLANFVPILLDVTKALVIVNCIGIILAWPFAKYLCYCFRIPLKYVYAVILVALFFINYYIGYMQYATAFYFIVLLALLPIGYLLRRYNTMPLVFSFILLDKIVENFNVFVQLYL
tara:strand:+ start:18595 stop:19905 length:1311 start_codon:yes stop_codon:yes gene_type:complete